MTEPPPMTAVERERAVLRHLADRQARWMKPAGVVAFFCGVFLVGTIAVLSYFLFPIMMADGESVDGTRFTGGTSAKLVIFALFAVIVLFGLVAMIGGAIQAVTGRRSARLVKMLIRLASVLFIIAIGIRFITL